MEDVVYLVQHVLEEDGRDEDIKIIGIYQTKEEARSAIKRVIDRPGFREFPEGFHISKYPLNKDHWIEGFFIAVPK